MKKFMAVLLAVSLIIGVSTVAFAAENDTKTAQTTASTQSVKLTPEEKQQRDAYKKAHAQEKQQLDTLRQQIKDARNANKEVRKQIKDKISGKTSVDKQLKANVKSQLQQAKSIQQTIKTESEENKQLNGTYKEDIKNKDYTGAETAFKSIIDKKSAVLTNIKQIGTILNQALASLQ